MFFFFLKLLTNLKSRHSNRVKTPDGLRSADISWLFLSTNFLFAPKQWRTQEFFRGGVQQIQLRTEDRENGDLGAVAP